MFSRKLGCLPWALLWDMPIKTTARCPSCLLRLILWSNEKIVSSDRIWKTFCTSVEIWRDILCVATGWLLNEMNINWPCNGEIPSLCKYAKQWKHGCLVVWCGLLAFIPAAAQDIHSHSKVERTHISMNREVSWRKANKAFQEHIIFSSRENKNLKYTVRWTSLENTEKSASGKGKHCGGHSP